MTPEQADEAAVALGLARGWLSPEQVERRRAQRRARPDASLLDLLARYDLTPAHAAALRAAHQAALAGRPPEAAAMAALPTDALHPPTASRPAARIGRYEVVAPLGKGGMGTVLRVRDAAGRLLALKLLQAAANPTARARFEREARLLGRMTAADGFVPLLDLGHGPQGPFIVMPLLEGGNLRQRLERGRPTVDEALAWGRALASALAEAHRRGIVHRDVKPENVLFDDDGRPLLADLGLAKHFRDDVPGATWTVSISRRGDCMGTIGYMAPEQMLDAKAAGPPADVFALGAVLFECLAGAPAFAGESPMEVVAAVTEGRRAALRDLAPEAPAWLVDAVEAALAHDPAARPADGAALLRALRGTAPARRRPPFALAALGGAALLALTLAAVVLRPAPPPPSPASAPDAPASRSSATLEGASALDLDEALALARAAAPDAPGLARRARARWRLDDRRGALDDLTRAAALAPDDGAVWVDLGLARLALGDLAGAREAAERALERAPRRWEAWALRGRVRTAQGQAVEAAADVHTACELAPDEGEAWAHAAAVLAPREVARAAEAAERALALGWRTPEALLARAGGRRHVDRAGALADVDEALRLAPDHAAAHAARALTLVDALRYREALAALERACALDPSLADDGELARQGGFLYLTSGDLPRAVEWLDRVLAQTPDNALLRVHRGAARVRLGELALARADLDRALELGPDLPWAWSGRAALLAAEGDRPGALEALERALALAPDFPEALEARAALRLTAGDRAAAARDLARALALEPERAERLAPGLRALRGEP
ncbi:MAG: protein kinase [Planctomycetes bacterium]|nr:protein kinase [Planctomycetota bacterium]